jgi:hypothetical protein
VCRLCAGFEDQAFVRNAPSQENSATLGRSEGNNLDVMKRISANFDFLGVRDAQLVRLGPLTERYFKEDPNTCLIKLRQFGEVLAQLTAAKSGLLASPEEPPLFLLQVGSSEIRPEMLSPG